MAILILGTLDTKGVEIADIRATFLREKIPVEVVDVGILGEPRCQADVSREEFFHQAGFSLNALQRQADRGQAIEASAAAARKLVEHRLKAGALQGILSIGGSAGTTIGTAAMRAAPVGLPKVMVSTLASGDVRPYVGTKDIFMLHSVVDLAGLNRISRVILQNAAHAMIGLIRGQKSQTEATSTATVIAATMFGVTTPCVDAARHTLQADGAEVLTFHATGTGGQTMESLIRDGFIDAVLDITTTELADQLIGGVMAAGTNRLTAAAVRGIPQVISVGALDMVNFGPFSTVPEKFQNRRLYQHNANVTLMRTTPEENDQLGKEIAEKACASNSPTAILLPLRGVSAIDKEGQPFWWPEADEALFQSIRNWVYGVELIELDCHINDPEFAAAAVAKLQEFLKRG